MTPVALNGVPAYPNEADDEGPRFTDRTVIEAWHGHATGKWQPVSLAPSLAREFRVD